MAQATSRDMVRRRQRLLRETQREVRGKVVVLTHSDVVAVAEVRRSLRTAPPAGRPERAVLDLLGSVVRALCAHETVRVGGIMYVRSDEVIPEVRS